jgi:hypothetical protein
VAAGLLKMASPPGAASQEVLKKRVRIEETTLADEDGLVVLNEPSENSPGPKLNLGRLSSLPMTAHEQVKRPLRV